MQSLAESFAMDADDEVIPATPPQTPKLHSLNLDMTAEFLYCQEVFIPESPMFEAANSSHADDQDTESLFEQVDLFEPLIFLQPDPIAAAPQEEPVTPPRTEPVVPHPSVHENRRRISKARAGVRYPSRGTSHARRRLGFGHPELDSIIRRGRSRAARVLAYDENEQRDLLQRIEEEDF